LDLARIAIELTILKSGKEAIGRKDLAGRKRGGGEGGPS